MSVLSVVWRCEILPGGAVDLRDGPADAGLGHRQLPGVVGPGEAVAHVLNLLP